MKLFKKSLKNIIIIFFWLGVWELLALAVNQELFLPHIGSVIKVWAKLCITSGFWVTVMSSIFRITFGILIAVLAGSVLAVITSKSRFAYDLLYPLLTAIKATPVASFIILAIIWMGAERLPIFISALMVFPIVWAAVSDGIKSIDPKHRELASVFKFSFLKRLKLIYLPTVAPFFLSACKTSIGLAWKAGIAAEVLAYSPTSIGKHLSDARIYYEIPELFAWTLTVIILSLAIEALVTRSATALGKKYALVRSYAKN